MAYGDLLYTKLAHALRSWDVACCSFQPPSYAMEWDSGGAAGQPDPITNPGKRLGNHRSRLAGAAWNARQAAINQ